MRDSDKIICAIWSAIGVAVVLLCATGGCIVMGKAVSYLLVRFGNWGPGLLLFPLLGLCCYGMWRGFYESCMRKTAESGEAAQPD